MPTYTVTDPDSGRTVDLTGDSPPTEEELNQIFASVGGSAPSGAPTEAPGALKSFGLGAMSGVPGAETAISAGEAALTPKTFEEAHQGIESAKDAAWNAHPVAYGGGKGVGLLATGVAAPEGLPGALAVGAASGADVSAKPSDIPLDAATGGATGFALGRLGEDFVAPAIKKAATAIPNGIKNLLASFGKGTSRESIDYLLAHRDLVENAMGNNERGQALMDAMNRLSASTKGASNEARGLLSKETPTLSAPLEMASEGAIPKEGVVEKEGLKDNISPIFDKLKATIAPEGIGTTAQKQAALDSLDKQKQILIDVAAKNGGSIPESRLGDIVRDIQASINPSSWGADSNAKETQLQLKALGGELNKALKGVVERDESGNIISNTDFGNEPYRKAMEPVAENTKLLENLDETFKPDVEGGGRVPSEASNVKMGSVLNEPKTTTRDLLEQLRQKEGFDFLTDAKAASIRDSFGVGDSEAAQANKGSGMGLRRFGAIVGTGVGATMGHPWQGGFVGGGVASLIDGGPLSYRIVSAYVKGTNSDLSQAAQAALQRFGPTLANAAKQGGNRLAATHFVLATSDPAYQGLLKEMSDNPAQENQ